jgi:large subunit ribosomal protein L21
MFAIVRTGGKQYRVGVGDQITVERLVGEVGAAISLDEVLAVGGEAPRVGTPVIAGASVTAKILQQPRGTKIIVFKKKRRKHYKRTKGHRQGFTTLKIDSIG